MVIFYKLNHMMIILREKKRISHCFEEFKKFFSPRRRSLCSGFCYSNLEPECKHLENVEHLPETSMQPGFFASLLPIMSSI